MIIIISKTTEEAIKAFKIPKSAFVLGFSLSKDEMSGTEIRAIQGTKTISEFDIKETIKLTNSIYSDTISSSSFASLPVSYSEVDAFYDDLNIEIFDENILVILPDGVGIDDSREDRALLIAILRKVSDIETAEKAKCSVMYSRKLIASIYSKMSKIPNIK